MAYPVEHGVQAHSTPLDDETYSGFRTMETLRKTLLSRSLVETASIEELVASCLEHVITLIEFEYCAVYVLDRRGVMTRVGFLDKAPVGKMAIAQSSFAEYEWTRLLNRLSTSQRYWDVSVRLASELEPGDPLGIEYERTSRELSGVIRLPLNGSSSTFGFIEAANRLDEPVNRASGNLRRFLYVAPTLANAITLLRARKESFALASVVKVLAESESRIEAPEDQPDLIFGEALSAGLASLSDYRAAIVNVESEGSLTVLAKAANPDITWDEWQDSAISKGLYLSGLVYETGTPRIVADIESEPGLFVNITWVRKWCLKSCACLPLRFGGRVVGVFTVFTGFRYEFSDLDRSLLLTIADSLAIFWGMRNTREHIQQQLNEHEDRRVSDARVGAVRPLMSLLHQTKNHVVRLSEVIAAHSATSELRSAGEIVKAARKNLEEALNPRGVDVFEVRDAVRDVIRVRRLKKVGAAAPRLETIIGDIPPLKMPIALFNEIVYNLISNAERAIRVANRRGGLIRLEVAVATGRAGRDLVISVTDDGIGIPRDKQEVIFEQDYTEFRHLGGTGKGLFLSRDIANDFGGSAYVERSIVGKGTTMTVKLNLDFISA